MTTIYPGPILKQVAKHSTSPGNNKVLQGMNMGMEAIPNPSVRAKKPGDLGLLTVLGGAKPW